MTQKLSNFDSNSWGNTKPMSERLRSYCMTIFNEDEQKTFQNITCRYKCWGIEKCPTTGRIHWQCYIYFKSQRTFSSMKKKFPTANFRVCKGTPLQNRTYCLKDGIFTEEGNIPNQGGKISLEELKTMSNEEIIERDMRCHKAYIHARDLLNADIDVDEMKKDVIVYYIQGPSGVGKTEKAKEIIRASEYGPKLNLIKYVNDFYLGCGSAKIALYDDFRDSHMKPAEFINLIDYNKHLMNIKGGEKINNYNVIIFTSVQNIDDIYKNVGNEPRKQWIRRINVIDMFKENELDINLDDI